MRSTLRRLGVTTVTIAALAATGPVPAYADPTTGSISGTLTEAGVPVAGGVHVYDTNFQFITSTTTDQAGTYAVPDLAPGGYKLFFFVGEFSQWAHQKLDIDLADVFSVTAGATTVVDEQLLPSGSLSGTLPTAPAGTLVHAQPRQPGQGSIAGTDDQGRFEMPRVHPGSYSVSFELPGGATQHYPGTLEESSAQPVQVTAGQRTAITDTLLPLGSTSGRLVEDGAPVENTFVTWVAGPTGDIRVSANTDADGRYRLPYLFAATYRVEFRLVDFRRQWAHGKLTEQEADTFPVVAGTETVVDETVLPTGQVRVRAVDANTGVPVTLFCADVGPAFACADDGVATFAKVTAGQQPVVVQPSMEDYLQAQTTVDVPAGGTVELTVRLTPSAFITTVVRDRATGAPVPGACVKAVPLVLASLGGSEYCADEQGNVRVARLTAGTYTLFVTPQDGVHGMQWVGRNGGTGSQFTAQRITVQAGQTAAAPPVRLDGAGAVAGRVTDKRTGAPLAGATIELLTGHPGGGEGPRAFTDENGRYTFGGLGPYEWPLHFVAFGYATQWSGAAPSRLVATPVRVSVGQTRTANAALTLGTKVQGTGVPEPFAFVIAYDAVTGDIVAATAGPGTTYQLKVLGPMAIRIRVQTGIIDRWHRRAADFAHATVILVPSSGTRTVNLEL